MVVGMAVGKIQSNEDGKIAAERMKKLGLEYGRRIL